MSIRSYFPPLLSTGLLFCTLAVADESRKDQEKTRAYPTSVIVDYVIGCMASNGQTSEMLHKCSCSIDFIAKSIPYDEYEQIETLLRLQQMPGVGRNAIYANSNWSKTAVSKLREVQAESTLRCF
ncbi:MAG: hypothetical protein KZQ89_05790 [Candidatus Thiodiazotropha sp. (ex Lucinoma kastoroae)]|nr:hypothetical protein [Candidatus Thiodiazotropha sp. (ex Rostrolucina anterorostrata)]MCU7847509.1 hypothetical protein [Candidatus Thiodiazotropha sp. (ex Lucinoma kastoroae)]MCU7861255.1 hypothetical protein [Candidatus Thiodiazotropha sp. (ex Lucinoma kastoroae)]